ncbi:hypothetical protein CJT58_07745 [Pseudomonas aeruginosa]|nr:hypothetical protein HMPREF2687_00405 [Pseudomonas aeruginosa]OHP46124.1 hypothetical protein HMPREF2583_00375 [Pseudomonas aeruginosa]PBY41082.1 hypothetical protein CJT58_07745 [Pseudomonas aeruginosa]PBZ06840.1 hypothetical protein CJT41_23725 [Pseudomonas aeruginosa]PCB24708.1 hypothetical protein CJT92_29805 [Pseudomonas aeruginosa]
MQQRITLTHGFRKILVEVAKEAGIPFSVGKVVDDLTAVCIDLLEEVNQTFGTISRNRNLPEGVMAMIQELRDHRIFFQFRE